MFSRLSRRYDLMNTLMSFGAHQRWRLTAARDLAQMGTSPESLLDYGAGTGDFARAALQVMPFIQRVILHDGSEDMLALARQKLSGQMVRRNLEFIKSDALALPVPGNSIDVVTAGFILRNLPDLTRGLAEIHRVLRPGGRLAVIEIFSERGFIGIPVGIYKRWGIPLLARIVTGDTSAFHYLNDSIAVLPSPEGLSRMLENSGFTVEVLRRISIGFVYEIIARKHPPEGDPSRRVSSGAAGES